VDSTKGGAIIETLRILLDPNSNTNKLVDFSNDYRHASTDALASGDVWGAISNAGISLGTGALAVLYGAVDGLTELGAGAIDGIVGKVNGVIGLTGELLPGKAGEVITDIAEGIDSVTETVTGWISGLCK